MTTNDQMIPANKVRAARDLHRDAAKMATITDAEREIHQHVADAMEALLPTPPTLADMAPEERRDCQWMQADTKPWGRVVILVPDLSDGRAALLDIWGDVAYEPHTDVTPRPDLPRMEWPGTEKPAPAPALPDGWLFADHKRLGRVIVTRPEPDADGDVVIVSPAHHGLTRTNVSWCHRDKLTYLDAGQGADTSDAVPPNTLAVGSAWGKTDALAQACRESERDQIIALDRAGDAYVWSEAAEWWESVSPMSMNAPFTILHAGKKAHQ